MLSVSYLGEVAVFSFLACLPTTIYYSKSQSVLVKTILHTILLRNHSFNCWISNWYVSGCLRKEFTFFFTILVVDILVRLFNYLNDCHLANEINKALKSRKG